MKNVNPNRLDLILIIIWPMIASMLSFFTKANAFLSIVYFLIIPSTYLSIKGKEYTKKAALFSIFPALLMIIVDYLAHINNSWLIPNSIFPFRLFGFVTIELITWTFFISYFIVLFYEYFLDKHIIKNSWKSRMKYLAFLTILCLVVFIFMLLFFPQLLKIPYFYLIFGVFMIVSPVVFQILEHPKVFSKFSLAIVYFFIYTFIWEVTALKLGWWSFPGTEFIGWLNIFGVSIPFEEFFFWCVLTAAALLTYFEFYDDDEK